MVHPLVLMEVALDLMAHHLASMVEVMVHPLVSMEGVMVHPLANMEGAMGHPRASMDQVGRESMVPLLASNRVEDWHQISLEGY